VTRPDETQGAAKLREVLKPSLNQSDLARELGVTRQAVYNWMQGIARPSLESMTRLEDLYGIPIRSWGEPASGVTQ
jgi:transcriptional regulator with XRE-family HTH domain